MATQNPNQLPDPQTTQAPATGMIASAVPSQPAQAQVYSTAPVKWDNTKDQTTAGQLEGLIKEDSPLMQQARTNALQGMNSRGLLNSSMAVGAAQGAVMDKAIPIANADATQASNVTQYNATQTNDNIKTRDQNLTQASGLNATEYNKILTQRLDNDSKVQLANIEATYKNQMQASQSSQQLYSQITKNMSDILMSDTMDAASKTKAINNQIALLNDGMQRLELTSTLDLGGILDFGSVPR